MKLLCVLNVLLLIAGVALGDIVLGSCGFMGLSGFVAYMGNKRQINSANAPLTN